MTPATRRAVVGGICADHEGVSERRVCEVLCWSRTSVRYKAVASPTEEAREKLASLARERPSWGYRRLFVVLRKQCARIGRRRFLALYAALGLARKRNPRRRPTPRRDAAQLPRANAPRESYACDFMHHTTTSAVTFRLLVVVDEFTREILALRVAKSFTTRTTTQALGDVFAEYGTPQQLRCDNGSEFISSGTRTWLAGHKVKTLYSRPAKPCDNGLCESTNGRIRDELLSPNLFASIDAAEEAAAAYRIDYNENRPHSSLKNLTPNEFYAKYHSAEAIMQGGPEM